MIHHQSFNLDQFAPIAVYHKIKGQYSNEITFLFESANNSDGNYSFIFIGARERLSFKDNTTTYIDSEENAHTLDEEQAIS